MLFLISLDHLHIEEERASSHAQVVSFGLGGGFTHNELPPSLVTFVNDFDGVLLRLGLTGEGKDVLSNQRRSGRPTLWEIRRLTSGFPSGIL